MFVTNTTQIKNTQTSTNILIFNILKSHWFMEILINGIFLAVSQFNSYDLSSYYLADVYSHKTIINSQKQI